MVSQHDAPIDTHERPFYSSLTLLRGECNWRRADVSYDSREQATIRVVR